MSRDIQKYTKDYLSNDFETHMVYYRQKQELAALNKYPHDRILEIGCALDPMFMHLNTFSEYIIVEPSVAFCENASKLAEQKNLSGRVKIINGFFEENPDLIQKITSAGKIDFILCSSILHEIEDPYRMLRAIQSVCTSKTVVHFNVPNSRSLHLLLAYESGLISTLDQLTDTAKRFQQHTPFNSQSLKEMLVSTGFSVMEIGSYFIKPCSHAQMTTLL